VIDTTNLTNVGLIYLTIGIIFSAVGAIIVRANGGMHFDIPSTVGVICMNIAIICWGMSLRHLELTYAAFIWYAADAVIVVIAGMFLFKEDMNLFKFVSICIVIAGIIGLNMASAPKDDSKRVASEKS
jgi:multidrug transporter EmrE-like cation transporter